MDDRDDDLRLPRAFYVEPLNEDKLDLSIPPATGEEYIQRVMLEAKKCDNVVVAKVKCLKSKQSSVLLNQTNGCPAAPPSIAPTLAWQEKQVADFSELRLKIARWKLRKVPKSPLQLPAQDDIDGWKQFCIGSSDNEEGKQPLMSIVLNMNQPLVECVLDYTLGWLQEANKLSHLQGRWLFALMACLELPLTPEVCSTLRDIARVCATIRANQENLSPSDATSLNLIICLVARYFRQTDLADVP